MKIIKDLEQGSDRWLQMRKEYFCASDCAAMMGVSKYKSRKQLLHEKKTGQTEPVDSFKQGLFDRGHEAEADAREIVELQLCESFSPVVGTLSIEGVKLLASLDGLSDDGKTVFEHKLYNATLAANILNDVMDPMYYWQLEQQLLVSGADVAFFVCSDGTESKMECMNYFSVPERREELIAGWKQFAKNLKAYKVEVKQEAVVATEAEAFPMVVCSVNGSMVDSNLAAYLADIKDRAEVEMNRVLETDQDFADKEDLNKKTVKARADLKVKVENIKNQFVSFADFAAVAIQIDVVLQKMQSQGEKQVKTEKENRKRVINNKAEGQIVDYAADCDKKIIPLSITVISKRSMPDFSTAMKGKRNLEAMQSGVDDLVAKEKIEIDAVMSRIVPNQIFLKEHATEYAFLFHDVAQIINQDTEPFQSVVKSRIADHKEAEQKKDDDRREEIRKEEEEKATKKAAEELAAKTPPEVEPKVEETPADDLGRPFEETAPPTAVTGVDMASGPDRCAVRTLQSSDDPFVDDIMEWAVQFNLTQAAVDALIVIIDKHDK